MRRVLATIFVSLIAAGPVYAANTCSALFVSASSVTPPSGDDALADGMDELNDASLEYMRRLKYLIHERRLISADTLASISAAPEPVNPFGARAAQVALLPHQQAFADLLREDLQWEKIRNLASRLSGLSKQDEKRKDLARDLTANLILPHDPAVSTLTPSRILRMADGRLIGVWFSDANETGQTLEAYELPYGEKVSQTFIEGYPGSSQDWNVAEVNGKVIASMLMNESTELVSVDVFAGKVLSRSSVRRKIVDRPLVRWLLHKNDEPALLSPPNFIQIDGRTAVATFRDDQLYLVDPFTGKVIKQISIGGIRVPKVTRERSAGGVLTLTSGPTASAAVIDPSAAAPVKNLRGLSLISTFTHNGHAFALGLQNETWNTSSRPVMLQLINLESGAVSPAFGIPGSSSEVPRLAETFEQAGKLYGVIMFSRNVVVADLQAGALVASSDSLAEPDKILFFEKSYTQLGDFSFSYKGHAYLVSVSLKPSDENAQLQILDALSLNPVGPAVSVEGNVNRVQVIAINKDDIRVLLSCTGWRSLLIPLTFHKNDPRYPGNP